MTNHLSNYNNCRLCPRSCNIDRRSSHGFCGEGSSLCLGFAGIHSGEEPPITGNNGSGTIFVSGCNLGCAFCQNYQISKEGMGREVSTDKFSEICLALQRRGAENINIVTGSHAAPALALGIMEARQKGLNIPVVWNSSAYDGKESLDILEDFVDIYLPDLKTLNPQVSGKYFHAPDYPDRAKEAILRMMDSKPIKYNGICLSSGVIIRHLILPSYLDNSREVLEWFAKNCKGRALLSLMTQYTPVKSSGEIPGRYVSEEEYNAVLYMLQEYEIDFGFSQELVRGSDWLPDFNRTNPFSSELSIPVWHWKTGFHID